MHGVVWWSVARCEIALAPADVARYGGRHGGGVRRRRTSFAVKGLEESLQVVALGVDEVGSLGAGQRGRNEAAGLGEIVHLRVAGRGCWVGGLLHHFAEHREDVGRSSSSDVRASGGHVKPVQQRGGIGQALGLWWWRLMRRLAEEVDADVLDGRLNSIETGSLALGVDVVDQVVDLALVGLKPWVNVGLVDVNGALLARHDKVEVQCEAHPGVEWYPVENEVELRLNHEEEREGRPVHQPWCEVGWVTCADGFVRGEDWKENRGDGAGEEVNWLFVVKV